MRNQGRGMQIRDTVVNEISCVRESLNLGITIGTDAHAVI